MKNKTAILITTYCGGVASDLKRHMTKTICKRIKESNPELYICLVSHSTIDEDTQQYCDLFLYDADNSFQINGLPAKRPSHAVAELKLMWMGVKLLKSLNFTHFLKLTYDNNPAIDYSDLIMRCEETNNYLVTAKWYDHKSLATNMFYSDIEFFEKTLTMDCLPLLDHNIIECIWYYNVLSKGLMDNVCLHENYENFFEFELKHFCHYGGTHVEDYPF